MRDWNNLRRVKHTHYLFFCRLSDRDSWYNKSQKMCQNKFLSKSKKTVHYHLVQSEQGKRITENISSK